jgi:hypothetical protein
MQVKAIWRLGDVRRNPSATGQSLASLGALGLLGWRRKRKARAVA